jgi:Icc-related predicted phosphoesterase
MIIDCISDLHGHFPVLAGGDLLIIAGDIFELPIHEENLRFVEWMNEQQYRKIVYIAGNHDNYLNEVNLFNPFSISLDSIDKCYYLLDSYIEFEGLKIWGSPWTKTFKGMNASFRAFALESEEQLKAKWELIDDDTDILVTHSPAFGMLDKRVLLEQERSLGSTSLTRWISNHANTLKLHVCGHIHEGYGKFDIRKHQKVFSDPSTPIFVNASHMNECYHPKNPPIRIIF